MDPQCRRTLHRQCGAYFWAAAEGATHTPQHHSVNLRVVKVLLTLIIGRVLYNYGGHWCMLLLGAPHAPPTATLLLTFTFVSAASVFVGWSECAYCLFQWVFQSCVIIYLCVRGGRSPSLFPSHYTFLSFDCPSIYLFFTQFFPLSTTLLLEK